VRSYASCLAKRQKLARQSSGAACAHQPSLFGLRCAGVQGLVRPPASVPGLWDESASGPQRCPQHRARGNTTTCGRAGRSAANVGSWAERSLSIHGTLAPVECQRCPPRPRPLRPPVRRPRMCSPAPASLPPPRRTYIPHRQPTQRARCCIIMPGNARMSTVRTPPSAHLPSEAGTHAVLAAASLAHYLMVVACSPRLQSGAARDRRGMAFVVERTPAILDLLYARGLPGPNRS
jgi:hypothetical protein